MRNSECGMRNEKSSNSFVFYALEKATPMAWLILCIYRLWYKAIWHR